MSDIIITLNNGVKMPGVGLGCFMGEPGGGERADKMVSTAFKLGYRHLDTAAGYENEEHVGKAVKNSRIPRSEIFLTTKLTNGDHARVKEAFEESLARLDLDYIDLYLMHWPLASDEKGNAIPPGQSPTYVETWKAMESQIDRRLKLQPKTLDVLLPQAKVIPAVNQIQAHPCLPENDLIDYCKRHRIHVTAYSPLGSPSSPFYTDETLKEIASKYKVTVAQILLSWGVQRGTSVIPKSENPGRLKQNFEIITLEKADFDAINDIHKKPGMHRQVLTYPIYDPKAGTVFGWTYDQMGWNFTNEGVWKE